MALMMIMPPSSTARPIRCTIPSFSGDIRLPRRTHSITTKTMRPPSSIGKGRMLRIARLTLNSMPTVSHPVNPPSRLTSPVSCAIPMGPDNCGAAPCEIIPPMVCFSSTSNSHVPVKLAGTASQMGIERVMVRVSVSSTRTPISQTLLPVLKPGARVAVSARPLRSSSSVISPPPFKLISRVR